MTSRGRWIGVVAFAVLATGCPSDRAEIDPFATGGSPPPSETDTDDRPPTPITTVVTTGETIGDSQDESAGVDATTAGSTGDGSTSGDESSASTGGSSTTEGIGTEPHSGSSSSDGGPFCGDGIAEAPEACDGDDLGGQTCADLGMKDGVLACTPLCALDPSGCLPTCSCGDAVLCAGEECDSANLDGETCVTLGHDAGTLLCGPACTFDESACITFTCGNGVAEGNEACDAGDLDGQTCLTLGHDGGALGCTAACTFDESACTDFVCGNGVIEGAESCDGASLGGQTCLSLGFDAGTLACSPACGFDTSGCSNFLCGNGVIEGSEVCDLDDFGGQTCAGLGFDGGVMHCSPACELTTDSCVVGTFFGSDGSYEGWTDVPAVLPCPDISATGFATGLGDEAGIFVPLGFTLDVYGLLHNTAVVQSNGVVNFQEGVVIDYVNVCMPGTPAVGPTQSVIAAMWDDFDPFAAGEVYTQTLGVAPNRSFVVSWWDVPFYLGSTADTMRISAVFYENSGDIDVCLFDTVNGGNLMDNGASATAAIQSSPTSGLSYSCNAPVLTSGLLIQYVNL